MSKKTLLWLSLGFILVLGLAAFVMLRPSGNQAYGAAIDRTKGLEVQFEKLFSDTSSYLEKDVIVEAKVVQVCQTSGCWLILSDGANQLFVQFYDFTLTKMSPGTRIRVQGQLRLQNGAPYMVGRGLEIVR